jgi:poly-gamma-glutamate capsule biosynthesis protein CapA/YwtB (metallophosphatase superfamily)
MCAQIMVLEAGADFVFGHGAHMNHGVEVIRAAAVCHCGEQLVFDWEQTHHAQDGMLLRLLLRGGKVAHVGFVCVSVMNTMMPTSAHRTRGRVCVR